jgi:hypothetical protein
MLFIRTGQNLEDIYAGTRSGIRRVIADYIHTKAELRQRLLN